MVVQVDLAMVVVVDLVVRVNCSWVDVVHVEMGVVVVEEEEMADYVLQLVYLFPPNSHSTE
jgi:hypothetical protein